MKTVTHKGKVYQLHSMYAFYDAGRESNFEIHELCGISSSGNFEDENTGLWGHVANELPTKLGTIEDAPIELEDEEVYCIDADNGVYGFYCDMGKHSDSYFSVNGEHYPIDHVDLTKIHKMVKAN